MQTALPRRTAAEFVGTFFLVFVGCGSMAINAQTGGVVGHLGIGLSWGLIVMAMIYAIGESSGAHINPAVTIAFAAAKRFPKEEVPVYIIAQLIGGLGGAVVLRLLFPAVDDLGQTFPAGSHLQSAVLELLLTFILMFVILGVCSGAKEKGLLAGVAIGGVVGMEAIFAGPICRASMNPARSIAPALVSLNGAALASLWLYIVAPILGALLAVGVFRITHAPQSSGRDPGDDT
ncbi:aquaporin [Phycisphaeraceae bacterium D3-23]